MFRLSGVSAESLYMKSNGVAEFQSAGQINSKAGVALKAAEVKSTTIVTIPNSEAILQMFSDFNTSNTNNSIQDSHASENVDINTATTSKTHERRETDSSEPLSDEVDNFFSSSRMSAMMSDRVSAMVAGSGLGDMILRQMEEFGGSEDDGESNDRHLNGADGADGETVDDVRFDAKVKAVSVKNIVGDVDRIALSSSLFGAHKVNNENNSGVECDDLTVWQTFRRDVPTVCSVQSLMRLIRVAPDSAELAPSKVLLIEVDIDSIPFNHLHQVVPGAHTAKTNTSTAKTLKAELLSSFGTAEVPSVQIVNLNELQLNGLTEYLQAFADSGSRSIAGGTVKKDRYMPLTVLPHLPLRLQDYLNSSDGTS
eukprot:gene41466-51349_t